MVQGQRKRIKGRDIRRDMIPGQRERNMDTIADHPEGRVIIERDEGQTEKEDAKHAQ